MNGTFTKDSAAGLNHLEITQQKPIIAILKKKNTKLAGEVLDQKSNKSTELPSNYLDKRATKHVCRPCINRGFSSRNKYHED